MTRGLLVILVGLALRASAAEDKLTPMIKKAEKLYQAGQYRESAAVLKQAYDLEPNPRLLYNIGRSYDQAGDLREAADYYQRYVGSSEGTDPQLLKRSALALERLRALIAKDEENKKREQAERDRMEAERKAAAERAEAQAVEARRAQMEAQAQQQAAAEALALSRKRQRAGAVVAGIAGVGGIAVGCVFGIQANSSHARFSAAQTAADKDALVGPTKQNALIADIGFGVGIAALAAAVLVYPKGGDVKVALVPAGNGAALVGQF